MLWNYKKLKIPIAILSALVMLSALADAGLWRRGTVETLRTEGETLVNLSGDAAAELYEYIRETEQTAEYYTRYGQRVLVVEGQNVFCAHYIARRLGVLRRLPEKFVCKIYIEVGGTAVATSARNPIEELNLIGVEN